MLRKLFTLVIFSVFVLGFGSFVSACEEWQIEINSASEEELTQIIHIGPSRAEQMVSLRPFDSVDDMIRITGIAEKTLADIKEEGFACVRDEDSGEKETSEETASQESSEEKPDEETPRVTGPSSQTQTESGPIEREPIVLEPTNLNPQDIKSEDNFSKTEINYALYGFVVFSILIGILFLRQNKKYKNEFR